MSSTSGGIWYLNVSKYFFGFRTTFCMFAQLQNKFWSPPMFIIIKD